PDRPGGLLLGRPPSRPPSHPPVPVGPHLRGPRLGRLPGRFDPADPSGGLAPEVQVGLPDPEPVLPAPIFDPIKPVGPIGTGPASEGPAGTGIEEEGKVGPEVPRGPEVHLADLFEGQPCPVALVVEARVDVPVADYPDRSDQGGPDPLL